MSTTSRQNISFLIVALVMLFQADVFAQNTFTKPDPPSIRITGEASIAVKPDLAQINIGVETQAQTAQSAAAQNSERLARVLAELNKALGSTAEIKTTSYSLSPRYTYPKGGGAGIITGYTASNVVQVKFTDLALISKVIDLSTQFGANSIQNIQFALKDEPSVRIQALREAASRAKVEAEAIASALGLKIVHVLFVEEGRPAEHGRMVSRSVSLGAAGGAPTPIEVGAIEVKATVTLTVEVAQ